MFDELLSYCGSNAYPFHMPGHKRNTDLLGKDLPYGIDITEINGFDYLHDSRGIILDIQKRAAQIYKCDSSFILINGSTGGILTAISACAGYGDKIITARNCHKSVYNALEINGIDAIYLTPEYSEEPGVFTEITPCTVETALCENPDSKAVVITSPTYEGYISNIAEIAEIAHKYNVPLIVDEAHGAHFGLSVECPKSATDCGADIAVMGLHKTLPALTQCALLNVKSSLIDIDILRDKLTVFQTSSPSYVLMSSVDRCLELIEKDKGRLFGDYYKRLENFYNDVKVLNNLRVILPENNFDIGKIIISTAGCNITGSRLAEILREEYNIELEMAYDSYALAMTSVCDTERGIKRLINALLAVDSVLEAAESVCNRRKLHIPEKILSAREAKKRRGEQLPLSEAQGKISAEYIYAYPPGIPLIVPGEVIDRDIILLLTDLENNGVSLKSDFGKPSKGIFVIK